MIAINDIHEFIKGLLKQNYGGFLSPEDIDRAVHSSSIDLFNQLIKEARETEKLPLLLKNFIPKRKIPKSAL